MTPLNINGLKFVRTWDSLYFIILLVNFTPCSPSQTRDALGKFVKKAIVHYRDDLDLQNLMDSIQKEVFPRPLPLRESTFGCCAACRTTVFTACRMGAAKPGRPLRPWASEPSVILAPAREIFRSARSLMVPVRCGSPHCVSHSHLHGLARLRTWVFPREKPTLAGCTAGKSGAVFLLLNINLSRVLSSQFKCCGWNNYTDWSWNLYFNCTQENPSYERCAVPHSCCIPIPGEVCEQFSFFLVLAS